MRTEPYLEWRPDAELGPAVSAYWSFDSSALGDSGASGLPREEFVVPDGCIDFIVDLEAGTMVVVGTMTEPLRVIRRPSSRLFGVRFRPALATSLMAAPADALTDEIVAPDDAGVVLPLDVASRLADAPHDTARVALLDRALIDAWRSARERVDRPIAQAAALIERTGGGLRVGQLADRVGVGRRQFERRFRAAVGVPAGTAGRVARFQSALHALLDRPDTPLSWIALDAGYHDQAHFTREFGRLAGETPGQYRARRSRGG